MRQFERKTADDILKDCARRGWKVDDVHSDYLTIHFSLDSGTGFVIFDEAGNFFGRFTDGALRGTTFLHDDELHGGVDWYESILSVIYGKELEPSA